MSYNNINDYNLEQFSHLVLSQLNVLTNKNEKKYYNITRLEKLIIYTADDIGFNNIAYGWYKHGFHSNAVHTILVDSGFGNLEEGVCKVPPSTPPIRTTITKSLKHSSNIFNPNKKETTAFFDWVYGKKCKSVDKGIYCGFYKWYRSYNDTIIDKKPQPSYHAENLYDIIDEYYSSLDYVDDDRAYNNFSEYMDHIESVLIKYHHCTKQDTNYLGFFELGKNIHFDCIVAPLTPFFQTLKGDESWIGYEKETTQNAIDKDEHEGKNSIKEMEKKAIEDYIMPTDEEIHNYSIECQKKLTDAERKKINKYLYCD